MAAKTSASKRARSSRRKSAETAETVESAAADKPTVTIEHVIAAEPSAAQAYMDGWTQSAPHADEPAEVTTSTPDVDTSSLEPAKADSIRLTELLEAQKVTANEPEVVEPRRSGMPTIPQYHAAAALSALNDKLRGNPSNDEENHQARLDAQAVKVADAEGDDATADV